MPRVFISYSHDSEPHRDAVLELAQQLRARGIDTSLDRFVPAPAEGWPRWMMDQVETADFVLLVCTATYRKRFEGKEAVGVGKGVTFEGLLATQHLYDGNTRNERFIPVLFEGATEADIPTVLRPYQRYTLPFDAAAHADRLEPLVRHLTGQPEVVAAPLGPLQVLPPRGARAPSAAPAATVAPSAALATPTALAPASVRSVGGADVRIEPIELLHRLLVSLFPTGDDFRRWVSHGPDGATLVAELPGGSASAAHLIAGGVEVLRSRGYLDAEFFARLRSTHGRRHDDIERAAAAWGTPLSVMRTTPSTPAPAARPAPVTTTHGGLHFANHGAGFDLARHLERLLPEVDHINITGIRPRPGASRDALRRPIETLYTPLRSHRPRPPSERRRPSGDALADLDAPESELAELPELLRAHHHLLIEGQPGSGKTTFLNLVACMLARDLSPGHPRPGGGGSWCAEHLGISAPAKIPGVVRMARLVPLLAKHAGDTRGDEHRWLLHLLALRSCPEAQLDLDLRDPDHQRRCTDWDELLRDGEAWLLLDGLDEVADERLRERVFTIFRVACARWKSSPILVTSRPIQTEALLRMGFHRTTIEPFEPAQIQQFVGLWSAALHEDRAPDASAGKARDLLRAIETRPELRGLAANPVMLTCLCVVHWNEGGLPEGRARVYAAVLHWMLHSREETRKEHGYTSEFAEYAFPSLALAMMSGPEGKRARFDLWEAAEALEVDVAEVVPDEPAPRRWARTWLKRECEWSHIVEEVEGDELKFWHLTMQEYAAARALAQRDDDEWWPRVQGKLFDAQWRKTLEFLPGCLYDEGGRRRVHAFLGRVLDQAGEDLLSTSRVVGLLGRLLPTLRAYQYPIKPELAARLRALQKRTLPIFTREGAAQVPAQVRVDAAEALAAAGFPRPAGDVLPLPGKGVALGKYPVTVAEFAEFVVAGGYADDSLWDEQGLRWREVRGWTEPGAWDSQKEHPTRPVVAVSWSEARAYCRWLERRLGGTVRLPTFAELRFAASPDGRAYPWGDETPHGELANFNEEVGAPTPVGVYPGGAGKFGHQDLAGNVWEWCEDGAVEEDPERRKEWGDRHWVTGGSWLNDAGALAAACRLRDWSGLRFGSYGFRVVIAASRG